MNSLSLDKMVYRCLVFLLQTSKKTEKQKIMQCLVSSELLSATTLINVMVWVEMMNGVDYGGLPLKHSCSKLYCVLLLGSM